MSKILTDAERQIKRQAILDAAANEIARFGYDRANINTIAEHAGIGRGTIYLYFTSKEEVLRALLDTIGATIDEAIERCISEDLPWRDRILRLAQTFVSLAEIHGDYFRVQVSALHGVNRAVGAPVSRWLRISIDRLTAALQKASAQGDIQVLPTETLATFIIGTLESSVLLPDALQQQNDPDNYAEILARILWRGMGPDGDTSALLSASNQKSAT